MCLNNRESRFFFFRFFFWLYMGQWPDAKDYITYNAYLFAGGHDTPAALRITAYSLARSSLLPNIHSTAL